MLLDNFHLVEGEYREIRHHLPKRYYLELPKLATRDRAGTARVYAMAVELLRYSDARLDPQRLVRFMNAYQTVAPLTIGEVWAWPSMLKAALIEHLRRLTEELLESRAGRLEADRIFASFEATRTNSRSPMLPEILHVAFVDEILQRMREGGADRRGAGAGRAARHRERAASGGAAGSRIHRSTRRLPPDRSRPPRARNRHRLPSGVPATSEALSVRPQHPLLHRLDLFDHGT